MSAADLLTKNYLHFKMSKLQVRELFYLEQVPYPLYTIKDGLFEIVLHPHTPVTKELLRGLLEKQDLILFIHRDQHAKLKEMQQSNLRNISRSLSIGEPLPKGRKLLNLMTLNMIYLYQDPNNDEVLGLQYQASKNLSFFLLENQELLPKLFNDYLKAGHHYIYAQPIISSLFLIGVLKYSHRFSNKEIETLFITSLFKDIGMSALNEEKYNKKDLEEKDRELLSIHPQLSANILAGRIPLGPSYLKIIERHHDINKKAPETDTTEDKGTTLLGVETHLINIMDIIAAMITGRPYSNACNIFEALDLTKNLISENYPQEFKTIVNYFKHFFKG